MHICPFIEQYTAKLNTPPTRDSRENRLSFFYVYEQKGATNHDKAKRETQGLKGSRERSVIPQRLCEHIVDICEEG